MDLITEADLQCPFCGEIFPVEIDTSQGDYETVQDCEVCCRPMRVVARCSPGRLDALDSFAE